VPRDHKELEVWKKAHKLAQDIYAVTKSFPKDEMYGLTAQLRRATVAISTNIAEGAARQSRKEFIQFCYIARGSASEVDSLLLVAKGLGILLPDDYRCLNHDLEEVSRMLTNLIKSLRASRS